MLARRGQVVGGGLTDAERFGGPRQGLDVGRQCAWVTTLGPVGPCGCSWAVLPSCGDSRSPTSLDKEGKRARG